jgi:hypothetical protein
MMASIFFTERLPGTFIFWTSGLLHIAPGAQVFDHFSRRAATSNSSFTGEHDDPSWLPQKQGLCQVVKMPDFEMLSGF